MALMAGAGAVASIAVGLPVMIELSGSSEPGGRHVVGRARAADAIAISAPAKISTRFPLTLDSGLVSLGDRAALDRGGFRGTVVVEEAQLTLDLSDPRGLAGAVPPAIPDVAPSSVPQIAGFTSGTLKLRRASLTLVGPHGNRATVTDVGATVTVTRNGGYKLIGNGNVNGHGVSVNAAWSDLPARDAKGDVPLQISLRSPVVEATLDGVLKSGVLPAFMGKAEFQLPSLHSFVAWIGLGRGVGKQLKSIVVSGPLEWNPGSMSFARANIAIDGNQATGAMTIKHAGERLSIDGTLGFQELDLRRVLPARNPAGSSQAALAGEAVHVAAHVLTVIDADLRLSAAKVHAPGFEMGRGAVSIALNKGRLQADVAEIEFEGGLGGGQLSIDLNDLAAKADVKLKLRNVDVGRVLAASLHRNPLLGRANVLFEGTVDFLSPEDALGSLAGNGAIDLVEPGRLGLDVAALMHAARSGDVAGWAAAGKGGTSLETMAARFRVLNGAIAINSVQARSGGSQLVGAGRLDVPGRLMDMSLAYGPPASSDKSVATQEVLTLRGTWDAPAIKLLRQPRPELKVEAPSRPN
jgi:hypothetical protein